MCNEEPFFTQGIGDILGTTTYENRHAGCGAEYIVPCMFAGECIRISIGCDIQGILFFSNGTDSGCDGTAHRTH